MNLRHHHRFAFVCVLAATVCVGAAGACQSQDGRNSGGSAGPSPPAAGAGLVGTTWIAMDIRGRGVLPKPQSRLTFETPKSVNGNGGCNRFFGPVEIDGETIAFGPLAATRMACAPAVDDQEQTFFAALADARRCSLDPQGLFVLYNATNEPILRFSRSSD